MTDLLNEEMDSMDCVQCGVSPVVWVMFLSGEPAFGWCSDECHEALRNDQECKCYHRQRGVKTDA